MSTECNACGAVWDDESNGPHSPDCPIVERNEIYNEAARLRELLREAEALIDSMATWFRSQPMGCPPAGTAQWQAKARAVLAAGVQPSFIDIATGEHLNEQAEPIGTGGVNPSLGGEHD